MDYLKSLTTKQWLIIFAVIIVFIASYLLLPRETPKSQILTDLETLKSQTTAPVPVSEESIQKDLEILKRQVSGPTSASTSQPRRELSTDEKAALLKLMSAPRR